MLEKLKKDFFNRVPALKNLTYWEKLEMLQMYSIERRLERYRIIYAWKILESRAPDCRIRLGRRCGPRQTVRRGGNRLPQSFQVQALGLAMWKFLAMRYHSASMREYAHFHITVVKKITILGPFFGLFLIDFWLFLLRILTVFARARLRPNFVLFLTLFFLPTMAHTDFVFRIASAYAHQSAYFRIIRFRMAIPSMYVLKCA